MPMDGDETMRVSSKVDTLHRETVRTGSGAEATVQTPLPAAAPGASATLLTPIPSAPAPKMRRGINPVYFVGFLVLLVLAFAALLLWPSGKRRESIVSLPETTTTAPATTATTATTATQPPPVISEAEVTVTSATADSTQLSAPITTTTAVIPAPVTTTTIAAVVPKPKPRPVEPRPIEPAPREEEQEETSDEPAAPAFGHAAVYQDGGDSDRNDRALAILRRELRGTTTVALRAGGMTADLARALREEFPNIQFEANAPVVIRFNGRNDRLGAGRKRRFATATVEKNRRIIFRYELPEEVYRVGDSSVEAFANVLGEAFQE
jgi:hypothetical protein